MANTYPEIPLARDRKEALSSVRYDHYLIDSSREIFKDGSKPIKEFLKMRRMVATPPCNSVREGRLLLAGQEFSPPNRVATEHDKKYTRSLLKELWKNDQNDECFSDFNEENMYASQSGRAKFNGVKRMKRTGVQAKRNFNSAHDIIHALFSNSKGEGIPEDIQHLLNLIKNYPAKAALYHIHASLLSLSKRQPGYFKMFEQLTYKMDKHEKERIYLKLPYIEEWRQRLVGNRLLERIYNFRPKTYEVSEPLQQVHQLTFQEQLEQGRKRKREES
ncbi:unnamed protein product [Urochloa humidicola]